MYIHFDKQTLELKAICGILEDYKPSETVALANQKTKELKEKVQKFMDETFNPSVSEIEELISTENRKHMVPVEPVKE
jgi:hypothetical protein